MHTASYEFLMKPKESAGCHQTLSARVGSGDETSLKYESVRIFFPFFIQVLYNTSSVHRGEAT